METCANQQTTCCERPHEATREGCFYKPVVDIYETDEALVVQAELPGTSPESVSLQFDRGTLTLEATVAPRQTEKTNYLLREYGVANFYRQFAVQQEIDAEHIAAHYKNGVLHILLPKAPAIRPKKVDVRIT